MKDQNSGDLVEILDINALIDPNRALVPGRFHAGEEVQERQDFAKAGMVFPSGESLPLCWVNVHYKD